MADAIITRRNSATLNWKNFFKFVNYLKGSTRTLSCTIEGNIKYLNVTTATNDRPHKNLVITGINQDNQTESIYSDSSSSTYKQINLDLKNKYFKSITVSLTSNYTTNLSDIQSEIIVHAGTN